MMKRASVISIVVLCLSAVQTFAGGIVPAGKPFLRQLTERDSILVADWLEYGFELDSVSAGVSIGLQDFSEASNDTLTLVRNWTIDTLPVGKTGRRHAKSRGLYRLRGSVILAAFEEGAYELPQIAVRRVGEDFIDTLLFEPVRFDVKSIPVDTATFVIHDIKGPVRYPLTFVEVIPYAAGALLLAALAFLTVWLVRKRMAGRGNDVADEPSYIVALRNLDRFRDAKYWAPDKQKAMYSGITDTLRTYIEDRFGVNAEEMTTAEIFSALEGCRDIAEDLFLETRELFELSDFVKFAKHTASDDENKRAIPTAVRFVTSTYQSMLDAQAAEGGEEAAGN